MEDDHVDGHAGGVSVEDVVVAPGFAQAMGKAPEAEPAVPDPHDGVAAPPDQEGISTTVPSCARREARA